MTAPLRHARGAGARRLPSGPPRPALSLVPSVAGRPHRTPFVLLVVAVLGAGLVGLLLLNTTLAQGSFQVHELERRTAALEEREQRLALEVDDAATPDNLARAARELGLVPARDPGFLRLEDGRVLGLPRPATAPPAPVTASEDEDEDAAGADATGDAAGDAAGDAEEEPRSAADDAAGDDPPRATEENADDGRERTRAEERDAQRDQRRSERSGDRG